MPEERSKLSTSVPLIVNVKVSLVSTSETEIVATAFWFSAAVNVEEVSIEGSSLTASILIVKSADEDLSPCLIVYVVKSVPL